MDYTDTNGVGSLSSKRIRKMSRDLLRSPILLHPAKNFFTRVLKTNIYYTVVVTVFLLFCTVLSFT